MKRGKKYIEAKKKVSAEPVSIDEAIAKVKSISTSKFEGKVEAHISLNVNEKEKKQAIRGSVSYKKPVGKAKRVLVFSDPKGQDTAKEAGADYYGLDDLISKVKDGWTDFDVAIATPSVMSKIAILGKALGTKGLMPNLKSGTVTEDIANAVRSYKGGKLDYRSDDNGVIHTIIGTVNSSEEDLKENLKILVDSVIKSTGKPSHSVIKTLYLTPTMGPSIKVKSQEAVSEE